MSRMVFFFVALGACAAFGGDYLVIDCHPPYKAVQYASAADLPRGGSFANGPADCRSAFRYGRPPEDRSGSIGVRLVLSARVENGR